MKNYRKAPRKYMPKARYARKYQYQGYRRPMTVKPDGIIKEKITIVTDWVASAGLGGSAT